ncbi:peptidoglycan editing factor PgeF [Sulfurimonas sp. SWIR-19]|uniref:peptidoglycan editing factor PgeF n=1 Tax=Sulfurimonas sp. SWIR-19 TaxID=2878390 RepID=UPI001CF46A33|nr:peptidoglycan editing factor PgeF [Sulfurimonas sp. SWIR-19]UCM99737.1 peptidoglycan editing factor PgeF [Sulfurimonas sp. SWIR-19]
MKFYQSKLLNNFAKLTHLFTCKESGNLAFHVQDNPKNVLQNHKSLAKKLHYDYKTLVHMKQFHSNIVKRVDENDNFYNPPACDAVITNKKNTPLLVMVADCSPVLFYDPKQNVIAAAHAGRTGAFENIVQNVIGCFVSDFSSDIKDLIVTVGPAICQKCYEINEQIYQEAKEKKVSYAVEKKGKKFYLDIRAILKEQFRTAGVLAKNIEISDICNRCNSDTFYSYRHTGKTGRYGGVIML